jgi:2-polyprenyl-3-methyl-5-hydroxy-6-metoxy-1,4-benzoquinol methylase
MSKGVRRSAPGRGGLSNERGANTGVELPVDHLEGIRCIVCGNTDEDRFRLLVRRDEYAVVVCRNCCFTFIPPYYRKQIDYTEYKGTEAARAVAQSDVWMKIQRHRLRYRLIGKYVKAGKLFDVGAGYGHFLLTGKQLGYDVHGIEMSRANVEFIRDEIGIEVDEGDFLEMDVGSSYDIVTMWDVLEHMDAADQAIAKISKLLNPGGYVFIQVPQIDSLLARIRKENWWMMGLDHVNYFSKKTIRKLLGDHGIETVRIASSIELKNVLLYAILPYLKRKKKKQGSWTHAERQGEFNRLTNRPMLVRKGIVAVHNIIYAVLSSLSIGEEMIVVGRKTAR